MLASKEGLCSMELVAWLVTIIRLLHALFVKKKVYDGYSNNKKYRVDSFQSINTSHLLLHRAWGISFKVFFQRRRISNVF
jgi:hypothetical protein